MRLVFDQKKAAQAAAYILKLNGGTINYMVLIKLLYLADRESLIATGKPITGDRMVSMPHGPVLSSILNLISFGNFADEEGNSNPWLAYVSAPNNYEVRAIKTDPETDELSRFEMGVLERNFNKFGRMDKWALVRLTHNLPEWEDPHGSSIPIQPETILRAVGKSDSDIREMINNAEEDWFISNLSRLAPSRS